jgi:hypothetical protein
MAPIGRPLFRIVVSYEVPSTWDPTRTATARRAEATAYSLAYARHLARNLFADWEEVAVDIEPLSPKAAQQLREQREARLAHFDLADCPF